MEVQVKEYKMKKKVIIIFSTIVGLKMVYIYIYVMFDALPLEMAFNVSCLRVDYSFSECQMGSMC